LFELALLTLVLLHRTQTFQPKRGEQTFPGFEVTKIKNNFFKKTIKNVFPLSFFFSHHLNDENTFQNSFI
jgi:hypothetical protein